MNQIDYILVPSDQKSGIKNCRVFNSADVNSDHSLLMAKYKIEPPPKRFFKKPLKRYDVSKLKIKEYAEEFRIKIGGNFETLVNEVNNNSIDETYNKFIKIVNETTEEVVGFRRRKMIDTLSKDTMELCERRRKLRKVMLASPNCDTAKEEYREINKLVKKEVRKAKNLRIENTINQLEDDFQKKNSHSLFKTVRELEGKPKKNIPVLKDANGKKSTNPSEIMEIWKNHFHIHLNTEFHRNDEALDMIDNNPTDNEDGEFTISKEDIRKAIASLKNDKAPGSDGITQEVLKAGGNAMLDMLKIIFDKILSSRDTPNHFAKMLVTPIFKKGDRENPANYRAISLLSIPGKVLNRILLQHIQAKTEPISSDRQYGFRPNRGTTDAIFIVRQLTQKAKERNLNLHFHFIDFKSAFDTIWRSALWKMMKRVGVNKTVIDVIKDMYEKSQCAVNVDGKLTDWFEVTVGVRQGCLLSPTLFNLFLEFVMDELNDVQQTASFDEHFCIDVRYADDTTLIAALFEKLQISTNQLQEACLKYGMKINVAKCKVISTNSQPISIDNFNVETVQDFVFLGSNVPSTSADVKRRITLGSVAFGKLKQNIWSRKDISTALKVRLYNALILPIAIYGAETWSMTKSDTKKLHVFENNCLRSILGVKLQDRVSIVQLRKRAALKFQIEDQIKKRRLSWFGHVARLPPDSLSKRCLKQDFETKRKRGRPAKRWQDLIREDTGLPLGTAERYAQNKELWRKKVHKWAKPQSEVCR